MIKVIDVTTTLDITVMDTYGRPWDGLKPDIGVLGHVTSEEEEEAAQEIWIGGTAPHLSSVELVQEHAFHGEHGPFSHFRITLAPGCTTEDMLKHRR